MNDDIRGARPRVRSHWRTIGAALGALGILAGAVMAAEHLLARSPAIQAYTVANTTQDGCNPYQVQAVSLGTFNLRVCISDNGTGTTAYPRVEVDQVPPYLGTSCSIGIELWDGANTRYGTDRSVDCSVGSHDGAQFGPVSQPLTLHAFARLNICLVNCTSYYLGNGQGDSPAIQVQPFVETSPSASRGPSTETKPLPPPLPAPPSVDQSDQPMSCSEADMKARLALLPTWVKGQPTRGAGHDEQMRDYQTVSGRGAPVVMAGQTLTGQQALELSDTVDAMQRAAGNPATGLATHAEPKVAAYMSRHVAETNFVCLVINKPDGPCDVTVTTPGDNLGMQVGCLHDLPDMLCKGQTLDVFWQPPGSPDLVDKPFVGQASGIITVPNRTPVDCG